MKASSKIVAAAVSVLAACGAARAVVVAGSDATYGAGAGAAWTNVGSRGVGSAVYVGNGWVITAAHVGAGDTFLNGVTYGADYSTVTQLREPDQNGNVTASSPTTDLVMFKLTTTPNLPSLAVATSSPTAGTSVTMVGYGSYRATGPVYYGVDKAADASGNPTWTWTQHATAQAGDYAGFGLTTGGTKRWGTAVTAGFSFKGDVYDLAEFGDYTYSSDGGLVTYFATNYGGNLGDAQAASGDSGGGVFGPDGALIGIMDAATGSRPDAPAANLPDQPTDTIFGEPSSTVDLDVDYAANTTTYITDIATYYPQIASVAGLAAIPEPTSLAPAALACGALFVRCRRAQR